MQHWKAKLLEFLKSQKREDAIALIAEWCGEHPADIDVSNDGRVYAHGEDIGNTRYASLSRFLESCCTKYKMFVDEKSPTFNHSAFDAYMRVLNAREFCFVDATEEYLAALLEHLESWVQATREELAGFDTSTDIECSGCGRHRPFGPEDDRVLTPDGKLFCRDCFVEHQRKNPPPKLSDFGKGE